MTSRYTTTQSHNFALCIFKRLLRFARNDNKKQPFKRHDEEQRDVVILQIQNDSTNDFTSIVMAYKKTQPFLIAFSMLSIKIIYLTSSKSTSSTSLPSSDA